MKDKLFYTPQNVIESIRREGASEIDPAVGSGSYLTDCVYANPPWEVNDEVTK